MTAPFKLTAGAERAHAYLSASGAKKWMTCSMSPAMEYLIEDKGSDYSRQGTCGHAVGEVRIFNKLHPQGPYQVEALVADYAEFFNKEFSDHVDSYVDYVWARVTELREQYGEANVVVLLEQRLDFSRWVPQGFGTGDVVIIVPGKIIVIDLKFGQGVTVYGDDNPQLKLYGLGAWVQYDSLYDLSEVEVVIHQPRKSNVSGETIAVTDLLEWAEQIVRPRAALAWAVLQSKMNETDVPAGAIYKAGSHCSDAFCKARYTCGARARQNMQLDAEPYALGEPETLTLQELEHVVQRAKNLAKWAGDIEGYLLRQAIAGKVRMEQHKLVEGRASRVITDDIAAAVLLQKNGFAARTIYKDPELLGLTALEKVVGVKKLAEVLGDLLTKPPGKTTLAPITSKAEALPPPRLTTPEQDFS